MTARRPEMPSEFTTPMAETGAMPGFAEGGPEWSADGPRPRGVEVIHRHWQTLDDSPGVYRMLDDKGEVLYVGKARSLRKRVANYTNLSGHNNRIQRMILQTASMVFVTTRTEVEALLLEANLIKRFRPRYNVLLRDDKSFPYIRISAGEWPMLSKHRGARSDDGDYFGPFAASGAVWRTLNQLQKAFLLRSCADSVFKNRTRPCLLYQIKRCSAPCVGLISASAYAALVADAKAFLMGRSTHVQAELAAEMQKASAAMEFERAAGLRDRIRALTAVQLHQGINPKSVGDADVIALHEEKGQACIQVFFFRAGHNWGNRAYFPRLVSDVTAEEILESFVTQFYDAKLPPPLVLLSHEPSNRALVERALGEAAGRRVQVAVPMRGEKHDLIAHALSNAREALGRHMAESTTQLKLLEAVAEAFQLEATPQRIEVYDNSHFQGSFAVGAMIVAGPEGFEKNQYRKFNIKSEELTPGDDFAMMREVLTRRFRKLIEAEAEGQPVVWPDLVLIDGGAGQLSAAQAVFDELGIDQPVLIAVAKGELRDHGREVFHRTGYPVFALPSRDPTLYFLQRLRDEAHRYAIGAHRARRAQATTRTPLDEVPGIGPARKRALLTHFGSAKAVAQAGVADLAAVEGISTAMAKRIHDFFHGERG